MGWKDMCRPMGVGYIDFCAVIGALGSRFDP